MDRVDSEKLIILILDDDATARHMLSKSVPDEFSKILTKNYAEFKTVLNEIVPDIFFLDIILPDADGIEICKTLRNDKTFEDSFILLITGSFDAKTIENGYNAGANDFIRKPFIPYEIMSKLAIFSRILKIRRSLNRQNIMLEDQNSKLRKVNIAAKNIIKSKNSKNNLLSIESFASTLGIGYIEIIVSEKGKYQTILQKALNRNIRYKSLIHLNRGPEIIAGSTGKRSSFKIKSGENTIYCTVSSVTINEGQNGYIILQSDIPITEYDQGFIDLLSEFISIMNLRLSFEKKIEENNKEFSNELIKVRKIQLSMMPDFRKVKGYTISSTFLPARDISGDFFDGFFITDDIYQIVLCDVSGHGMSSAYIGNEIRTLFRIYSNPQKTTAEIVKSVNDIIAKDLGSLFLYCTAILLQINIKTGKIFYTNAGHPSILKSDTNGKLSSFAPNSPLVGLFQENDYENGELVLDKEETILLYTDGITEASADESFDPESMFGDERLKNILAENNKSEPSDILNSITHELYTYVGYRDQNDDITAICIKKK